MFPPIALLHLSACKSHNPQFFLSSDEGLTLDMSALETLYGGQFTFIYQFSS